MSGGTLVVKASPAAIESEVAPGAIKSDEAERRRLAGVIVPYMFVYAPALLWHGSTVEIVWAAVSAGLGVIALSAGVMGFLRRPATWSERAALIVAALLLIKPGIYTDLLGLAIGALVLALQRLSRGPRRQPVAA